MITNIGYKSYIVFAVVNFFTIPVVYFYFPETSQRPLETVDLLFENLKNGERPSIITVVKNSTSREFVAEIESQLVERARIRSENNEVVDRAKRKLEHVELIREV